MPPKAKVTKEMIINAAFEIVRTNGIEKINARDIAKKLNCSTQPVMYYFDTVEEIKKTVYAKLDWFHTDYLMNFNEKDKDVSHKTGLNYIRFAINEPNLFRFLFQSGYAVEDSLLKMVDSEELVPVIKEIQKETGMNEEKSKKVFTTVALFAHGYASIIANNSLKYDERIIIEHLNRAYRGAVLAVKEEM